MYNQFNQNNYWYSVNGYEGAKNFNTAPNQTILLVDTSAPYMYMKSANQMGQTTLKCFKIEELPTNPEQQAENERFDSLDERLKKIETMLTSIEGSKVNV